MASAKLPPPLDHEQPPIDGMISKQTVRRIPLAPHQLSEAITPNKDVFVLAHVGIPKASAATWWLDIAGMVDRPIRLSFADLAAMPKRTVTALLECAGFPTAPHIATRRYANVTWGGVDLASLLADVGIDPRAGYLWSHGIDRGRFGDIESGVYIKDMPLSRIPNGDVLLAYEFNGEPLDHEHGFPLRLIIPGYYGTNSVKWLYRLELSDRRATGPFTTTLYNDPIDPENSPGLTRPVWELAPESIIVSPAADAELNRGPVHIWGWAWADGGIRNVDLSVDGGESWSRAEVSAGERWAWQKFTFDWPANAPGPHTLMTRAIDMQGRSQPLTNTRNCVYAVPVTVR